MDLKIVLKKAAGISLVLFDCDGILTDGGLHVLATGEEVRRFDVHDGYGIRMLHYAGVRTGIVSGKESESVRERAQHLGMEIVRLGNFDKLQELTEILESTGLSAENVAYAGDDIFDIPAMKAAGLSLSVSNARPQAREAADYVTEAAGGHGAVREMAELILKAKGLLGPDGDVRR